MSPAYEIISPHRAHAGIFALQNMNKLYKHRTITLFAGPMHENYASKVGFLHTCIRWALLYRQNSHECI